MRYIRKQISIKVIADEVIEDVPVIKELMQTFQKAKTDVAISYRKNQMEFPVSHERVRVISVYEDSFDITVVNSMHTMNVRKIPLNCVEYVSTTVSPSEIFLKKENIQKGDTLDLS